MRHHHGKEPLTHATRTQTTPDTTEMNSDRNKKQRTDDPLRQSSEERIQQDINNKAQTGEGYLITEIQGPNNNHPPEVLPTKNNVMYGTASSTTMEFVKSGSEEAKSLQASAAGKAAHAKKGADGKSLSNKKLHEAKDDLFNREFGDFVDLEGKQ